MSRHLSMTAVATLAVLALTGCGKFQTGTPTSKAPSTTTPVPPADVSGPRAPPPAEGAADSAPPQP